MVRNPRVEVPSRLLPKIFYLKSLISTGKSDEDIDPEIKEEGKKIIMQYSEALVQNISVLFQLSIDQSYQVLQEESLVLLSSLAELMAELFANHYGTFMPGLMSIL